MMGPLSLSQIAQRCGGVLVGADGTCTRVVTDSRRAGEGALFVALKGERFDAHDFVQSVAEQGASAALVNRELPVNIAQIIVPDTLKALGQIAELNRDPFEQPVVAITGSGGKTSVKEMLASMLRCWTANPDQVLATQGNLNNDIGVPLTLLELKPEHRFAVIELGASAVGEIAYTVALTKPDVALLNNALPAHVEGFGSLENIVRAKAEIYNGLKPEGIGIVNLDDPHSGFWLDYLSKLNRSALTFGLSEQADVRAVDLKQHNDGCYSFTVHTASQALPVTLNVMGRHMVLNALAAIAAWSALGLALARAAEGLEAYTGFKGRLQTHRLANGALLVDDSYNANPASMRAALEVLASLDGTRLFAMGDMAELGDAEIEEHRQLGDAIAQAQVDRLLACGALSRYTAERAAQLGVSVECFDSVNDLINSIKHQIPKEQVILVKGSRSAGMDQLVDALLEMDK